MKKNSIRLNKRKLSLTSARSLTRFGTRGFLSAMVAMQIAAAPNLFADTFAGKIKVQRESR